MDFNELSKIIVSNLKPKLESHKGLSILSRERSKFEGWLKVEVVDTLLNNFNSGDIYPEKSFRELFKNQSFYHLFTEEEYKEFFPKRHYGTESKKTKNFDVHISPNWLIELKIVITNYNEGLPKDGNIKSDRPLKDNVLEVLTDVGVLKKIDIENKAILFIVYPIPENKNEDWKKDYLSAIETGKIKLKDKNNSLGKIRDWELTSQQNLKLELFSEPFNFYNHIRGIIYIGLV